MGGRPGPVAVVGRDAPIKETGRAIEQWNVSNGGAPGLRVHLGLVVSERQGRDEALLPAVVY